METLETLRRDLNVLRDERDTLLGQVSGLYKVMAAIIQSHPDYDSFHLSLHRLLDAEDAGLITQITPAASRKAEKQVIDSLLTIQHSPPKKWTPKDA